MPLQRLSAMFPRAPSIVNANHLVYLLAGLDFGHIQSALACIERKVQFMHPQLVPSLAYALVKVILEHHPASLPSLFDRLHTIATNTNVAIMQEVARTIGNATESQIGNNLSMPCETIQKITEASHRDRATIEDRLEIRRRWGNKIVTQRGNTLRTAWKNIPTMHRPDFHNFRLGQQQGNKPQDDMIYRLPMINPEDLCKGDNFLHLLNSRGRHSPRLFANGDTEAAGLTSVTKFQAVFIRSPPPNGNLDIDDRPVASRLKDDYLLILFTRIGNPAYGLLTLRELLDEVAEEMKLEQERERVSEYLARLISQLGFLCHIDRELSLLPVSNSRDKKFKFTGTLASRNNLLFKLPVFDHDKIENLDVRVLNERDFGYPLGQEGRQTRTNSEAKLADVWKTFDEHFQDKHGESLKELLRSLFIPKPHSVKEPCAELLLHPDAGSKGEEKLPEAPPQYLADPN
ncbi:uncharacterized protein PAC_16983 [Phialocephala subalpina]|uniref:Uncharacterized protein n=1 Tax=Phialocephala subalpina TaxID=576137 RepID=A0A1L7XPX0_9HELO|nr:uncharacterized protein PAC_16983 [Phialocephala subalpina]